MTTEPQHLSWMCIWSEPVRELAYTRATSTASYWSIPCHSLTNEDMA